MHAFESDSQAANKGEDTESRRGEKEHRIKCSQFSQFINATSQTCNLEVNFSSNSYFLKQESLQPI